MSTSKLPERASLEYLKKLAKERLRKMRQSDPRAKLAAALLAVAREHGFPSWRALKAEVERRDVSTAEQFVAAAAKGDVRELRRLFDEDPSLLRTTLPGGHGGWTALHAAAKAGHDEAARFLLEHGADANAREKGDNTSPLHWAAAHAHPDVVRTLLDAGSDVQGVGDLHALDVIGWATVFGPPGDILDEERVQLDRRRDAVRQLLLERGARDHIFSAIAVGDLELIRALVEDNPDALDRRRSQFELEETALQFAIARRRYDIVDLLVELGADVDAKDMNGRTAMDIAVLRGDREAMTRLRDAGATPPPVVDASDFPGRVAALATAVRKGVVSLNVPDIAKTLAWYTSIGFKEEGRYADDGLVNWGLLSYGPVEIMLGIGPTNSGSQHTSIWIYTNRIDELYHLFKARQVAAARAALAGHGGAAGIDFLEDIYDPFYGGRQFSIRDLNGYGLIFYQSGE